MSAGPFDLDHVAVVARDLDRARTLCERLLARIGHAGEAPAGETRVRAFVDAPPSMNSPR